MSQRFKVLSKHLWQCKNRLQQNQHTVTELINVSNNIIETRNLSIANFNNTVEQTNDPPENRDDNNSFSKKQKNENRHSCFCGKECKGLRGLQAHKRACKVMTLADTKSLFNSPPLSEHLPVEKVSFDEVIPEKVTTLNSRKLPKTKEQWLQANAYFYATLACNDNNITDIETMFDEFQQTLYTYFRHNHGEHQNQNNWFKQHSNLSKSKLKKLLLTEKTCIHSNAELIRFLSKLLRSKYKNNGIIPDV